MAEPIRFHLDESVDPAIAEGLRRRGADVTTSQEAGLLEAADERQLTFAMVQQRTLVTHDEDFLVLAGAGIHMRASPIATHNRVRLARSLPHSC